MDHFDHHYVPQFLLRKFEAKPGLIWQHSFIASHESVRTWNLVSIKEKAAVHRNLYTIVEASNEDDRIEKWLEKEFESQGAEAVDLATRGCQLKPLHYQYLARLFASQDRRTPRAYTESMQYWELESPQILQSIGESLKNLSVTGENVLQITSLFSSELRTESLPFSFKQISENETKVHYDLGLTAGRKLWLWDMQHCLRPSGPIRHLQSHRWTILRMPDGMYLPISDSPTLKLGIDQHGNRNYTGAWNSDGTVLMMPLSPTHLLFTEIGRKSILRDTVLPTHKAQEVINHIVRRAFREVFSHSPDLPVEALRKRVVDPTIFQQERQGWRDWHKVHSSAERW